jgi:Domain of unknown function (DUF4387)/Acyclic terpene utilisation family protein AtuA
VGKPDRIARQLKGSLMPKLVYRVVSACGALGYGYPKESLYAALRGRVDALICDGGSTDAGPYYLGTGTDYFERDAIKSDYRHMAAVGKQFGCPVILGSSGMAGANRNLDRMIDIAKEVFAELDIRAAKVAVIRSEVDPELVIEEFRKGALRATGFGPEPTEDALRESVIVGQMGIHPLITALESGAEFVLAGRSCDAALFASDMIRRGVAPGLAYHVGHVLESGALACDPGSPSDCLVAEVYDDGTALFAPPNPARRCTAHSIAAHSLYERSHPQLQSYPEGILVLENTRFFSSDSRTAGIRNSRFIRPSKPWSIKLEGSRPVGACKVSLIHIDAAHVGRIPEDILVYGRNGVQATTANGSLRELGIIVETAALTQAAADLLARLLMRSFNYIGYPGRKAAAGNIAFPLSPYAVSFHRPDGLFGAIGLGGARDPAFIQNYAHIKAAVIKLVLDEFPGALANAEFSIAIADAANPVILLRTVDRDPEKLAFLHRQAIDRIAQIAVPKTTSRLNLDAPDAYVWSLYHLLHNEKLIKNTMFPITYYRANGAQWQEESGEQPRYFDVGETGYRGDIDERSLSVIADHPPLEASIGLHRLLDMAVVIRSKGAGINRLTFDIIFSSGENYELALYSNVFAKDNVAKVLKLQPEHVVGTFFVDACNAIKITIDRLNVSGSLDERDVFGVQQQAAIEGMDVPIYAAALSRASSF